MRRPSGLQAQFLTESEWPSRVRRSLPEAESQRRTVSSSEAEAMRRPSGLQAQLLTESEWPSRVRRSLPEAESQRRTVLSSDAEAMRRPSGLHAQLLTQSEWPSRVRRSLPEAESQMRTVLSSDPEAMRRPSGLHAQLLTEPKWPDAVVNEARSGTTGALGGTKWVCRIDALRNSALSTAQFRKRVASSEAPCQTDRERWQSISSARSTLASSKLAPSRLQSAHRVWFNVAPRKFAPLRFSGRRGTPAIRLPSKSAPTS